MHAEVGGSNPGLVAVGAADSAPPFAVFVHPVVEFAGGLPGCRLDGDGWLDLAAVSVGAFSVLVEHHIEIHGFCLASFSPRSTAFQLMTPPSQTPQSPEPMCRAANLTHQLEH